MNMGIQQILKYGRYVLVGGLSFIATFFVMVATSGLHWVSAETAPVQTSDIDSYNMSPAPVVQPSSEEPITTVSSSSVQVIPSTGVPSAGKTVDSESLANDRLKQLQLLKSIDDNKSSFTSPTAPQSSSYDMSPAPVLNQNPNRSEESMTLKQSSAIELQNQSLNSGNSVVDGNGFFLSAEDKKASYFISPRLGMFSVLTDQFDSKGGLNAGFGLGVQVSNYISLECGYGLGLSSVALTSDLKSSLASWGLTQSQALDYKEQMIDGGVRVYTASSQNAFRPFLGLGLAYGFGSMDLSSTVVQYYQNAGYRVEDPQYKTSQWLGTLSAGFEYRIFTNVLLSAQYKYYRSLAASENQPLPAAVFYSANELKAQNQDQALASRSLTNASFNALTVGASFIF